MTHANATEEGFEKLKAQLWEFMFSDIYPNERRYNIASTRLYYKSNMDSWNAWMLIFRHTLVLSHSHGRVL